MDCSSRLTSHNSEKLYAEEKKSQLNDREMNKTAITIKIKREQKTSMVERKIIIIKSKKMFAASKQQ